MSLRFLCLVNQGMISLVAWVQERIWKCTSIVFKPLFLSIFVTVSLVKTSHLAKLRFSMRYDKGCSYREVRKIEAMNAFNLISSTL